MKINKRKLLEVVLVVQICLCLQHVTYGNHNGAPSTACDNMTPSHGPNPQQTSNPYTVTLNTTSYTYGTIVNVTLSSPVGTLFKGYMIQMKRIEDDTMVSGFYIDDSGQLLACNNVEYSTVTHTENGDKNTSSFLWSAPSDADGQLRIVATVVESHDVFWTNIQSTTLSKQEQPDVTTREQRPNDNLATDLEQGQARDQEGQTTTPRNIASRPDFSIISVLGIILKHFV